MAALWGGCAPKRPEPRSRCSQLPPTGGPGQEGRPVGMVLLPGGAHRRRGAALWCSVAWRPPAWCMDCCLRSRRAALRIARLPAHRAPPAGMAPQRLLELATPAWAALPCQLSGYSPAAVQAWQCVSGSKPCGCPAPRPPSMQAPSLGAPTARRQHRHLPTQPRRAAAGRTASWRCCPHHRGMGRRPRPRGPSSRRRGPAAAAAAAGRA